MAAARVCETSRATLWSVQHWLRPAIPRRHPSARQAHFWQLGRLMPPQLCARLEGVGVTPSLYAASWLMTCYSADFPLSFSAR